MNCPECKAKLKDSVVGTESYRDVVQRHRRCKSCGALVETEETIFRVRPPSEKVKRNIHKEIEE